MDEFVVHGVPGSPYVRAVLLALEEKRATWRLASVAIGANRTAAYRPIHPFHKIPTLDHGDFRLYETRAILGYVDRAVVGPALTPGDACAVARMDQIIGIVDSYLMPRLSVALTFPRAIAPRLGLPVDDAAVAASLGPAADVVAEVARLLGEQRYMTGETLSLADLMVIPHLDFLPAFDEGRALLAPHAALRQWLDRMGERPSLARTEWDVLAARAAA